MTAKNYKVMWTGKYNETYAYYVATLEEAEDRVDALRKENAVGMIVKLNNNYDETVDF